MHFIAKSHKNYENDAVGNQLTNARGGEVCEPHSLTMSLHKNWAHITTLYSNTFPERPEIPALCVSHLGRRRGSWSNDPAEKSVLSVMTLHSVLYQGRRYGIGSVRAGGTDK